MIPEIQVPSLNIPSVETPEVSQVPDTSNTIVQPSIITDEGLVNPFLSNIPEQDRAIVQKYVKDWDANVTRRFQAIHDEYKPYKELGDFDRIQRAMDVVRVLEEDPQHFYQSLAQILNELEGDEDMGFDETDDLGVNNGPAENTQIDPRDKEIADLRKAVETLSGSFEETQKAQKEAQEMAELDSYLKTLHNEHGDFDDDWVLVQMSRGIDAKDAIAKWHGMIEESVNSRRKATPPTIIPGAGSVAGGQVDPSKFNPQQRKEYIAAMLNAAANQ